MVVRCAQAMALPTNQQPAFDFKIETAEVKEKKQGILFYVLPPLVVASVFVYCYLNSQAPETSDQAIGGQAKAKPVYSTTAQYVDDEEEEEAEDTSDE